MFSVLEPGAKLTPHKGVYPGVLRYHLALKTPAEYNKCCINISDTKNKNIKELCWKEGTDFIFDDYNIHWVDNNTNEERIILFLDIKKNFKNIFVNLLNNFVLYKLKNNYNNDSQLNKNISKINTILNQDIKTKIFPYFIEDVNLTYQEINNFYTNFNKINFKTEDLTFWQKYYTFMHRNDVYSMASKMILI